MTTSWRLRGSNGALAATVVAAAMVVGAGSGAAWAKRAKPAKDGSGAATDEPAGKSSPTGPGGVVLNACGCYRKGNSCACTNKNAKCVCPDDCEPVGCDEKRQKELDREMAAEVKRAEEEDKKRQAAEAERERKANESQNQDPEDQEGDDQKDPDKAPDQAGGATADGADDNKSSTKDQGKTADKSRAKVPGKSSKASQRERTKK
jgi:hypothetical protein